MIEKLSSAKARATSAILLRSAPWLRRNRATMLAMDTTRNTTLLRKSASAAAFERAAADPPAARGLKGCSTPGNSVALGTAAHSMKRRAASPAVSHQAERHMRPGTSFPVGNTCGRKAVMASPPIQAHDENHTLHGTHGLVSVRARAAWWIPWALIPMAST